MELSGRKGVALAIDEPKQLEIKKIEKAPYICTIPRNGIQAINCYPDAKAFTYRGRLFGYSRVKETIICVSKGKESSGQLSVRELTEVINRLFGKENKTRISHISHNVIGHMRVELQERGCENLNVQIGKN